MRKQNVASDTPWEIKEKRPVRFKVVLPLVLVGVVAVAAVYALPPIVDDIYKSIYYDGYSAGYDNGYSVGKAGYASHTQAENIVPSEDSQTKQSDLEQEILELQKKRDLLLSQIQSGDRSLLLREAIREIEQKIRILEQSTAESKTEIENIVPPRQTPALRMPVNGEIIVYPTSKRLCPLSVKITDSENYYVYLDSMSSDANDMSFMVSPGSTAEVDVPIGRYEIYYTSGTYWYGKETRFGSDAPCYKCDDVFDFYDGGDYYMGYELELYLQTNGNLDTDKIPEDQFPG